MKWFKHMTASGADPKLSSLIDIMGMEGYGLWWKLLEIVGTEMDDTEKCEVTYSLHRWSLLLYCHHHKASKFLVTIESLSLVSVVTMGSNRTVKIPNMLKFRDSHTKNLQAQRASKLPATCKQEVEGEVEGDLQPLEGGKSGEPKIPVAKFIPPPVSEVDAYCSERKNGIDAEEWWNFYESKGWMIGKNKMKSWKSAIVTWEKKHPVAVSVDTPTKIDPRILAELKRERAAHGN